jgi:hypothetical protein
MTHKKIAIVQSNYIPWKGYFDLIASVDELVLYDDVQFTKNDWRNRNKIKTPAGVEWISIPVGQNIRRTVREVELPETNWRTTHWETLRRYYKTAPHYAEISALLAPFYQGVTHRTLSELNRAMIEAICGYLGITTKISYAWDYKTGAGKTERLVDLCEQTSASEYVSGPMAKIYLDEASFTARGVIVRWFDYGHYPVYPQLWGEFEHSVSVLDLLFNCGPSAPHYMMHVR